MHVETDKDGQPEDMAGFRWTWRSRFMRTWLPKGRESCSETDLCLAMSYNFLKFDYEFRV